MSPNTLLLILLVALVFAIGFLFGMLSDLDFSQINEANGIENDNESESSTNTTERRDGSPMLPNEIDAPTDQPTFTLRQREILESLGIDADSITITEEMIACAEAELGSIRLEEIQNGDEPTAREGVALFTCYRE